MLKPFLSSLYTTLHTSSINLRSWDVLITAPGNSLIILRITGPDNGEKFLVGSSRIRTLAPDRLIFSNNTFAFRPPDSSRIGIKKRVCPHTQTDSQTKPVLTVKSNSEITCCAFPHLRHLCVLSYIAASDLPPAFSKFNNNLRSRPLCRQNSPPVRISQIKSGSCALCRHRPQFHIIIRFRFQFETDGLRQSLLNRNFFAFICYFNKDQVFIFSGHFLFDLLQCIFD